MITRLLHFKINPEFKNEFVTIASTTIENFRQMKGHRETYLFFKYQEEDSVVISSSWETLKDLEDFSREEIFEKGSLERGMLEKRVIPTMAEALMIDDPGYEVSVTKNEIKEGN